MPKDIAISNVRLLANLAASSLKSSRAEISPVMRNWFHGRSVAYAISAKHMARMFRVWGIL